MELFLHNGYQDVHDRAIQICLRITFSEVP